MPEAVTNMADLVYLALAWLFFKHDADLCSDQFLIINYKLHNRPQMLCT